MTSDDGSLGGRLLVATPQLGDPNFERTVVLLLEHGEVGAVGVVLNRPMHVGVGEILAPWEPLALATPPGVLFGGGPVSLDSVIGIARPPAGVVPEWRPVCGDVGVLDLALAPDDQPTSVARVRLFCGYAGWGAEQLEGEIDDDAWFVVDATPDDVFSEEPDQLWHDVLKRQGGDMAMLATYPPTPSVN